MRDLHMEPMKATPVAAPAALAFPGQRLDSIGNGFGRERILLPPSRTKASRCFSCPS